MYVFGIVSFFLVIAPKSEWHREREKPTILYYFLEIVVKHTYTRIMFG